MLPKLQNCIDAISSGVSRVHILDGRIPHCLLLEICTNKGIGTAILNAKEEQYYYKEGCAAERKIECRISPGGPERPRQQR